MFYFPSFLLVFFLIGIFRAPWAGAYDLWVRFGVAAVFALLLTLAIALARFLFASVPKKLYCEACEKYLAADAPWKCHRCDHVHSRTNLVSWLGKCEECGSEPAVFECPHCTTLNLFSDDADPRHCASLYLVQETVVVADVNAERKSMLDRLEFEIKKTELQTNLVYAKRELAEASSSHSKKEKSPYEKLEESFETYHHKHLGVHRIAAKKEKEAKESCGDDLQELENEKLAIKGWTAKQLREIDG